MLRCLPTGSTVWAKVAPDDNITAGLMLLVKKLASTNMSLQAYRSLAPLLDQSCLNKPSKSVLRCDRLLRIGGGIGIKGPCPR
ncbi:hypothetical protein BDY21DRAFT_333300 [Lineolata rhizophorae]|uniref:Uncharacterized protein n=1 Tax=Lineolata rhizophorae TaxID=578093 RepID=A0A6A6PAB7_9PEZI|nr:hypothetical protein BDY21DRAFT_333300 [Lineolata rhizophorae]